MEISFYEEDTGKLVGDLSGPDDLVYESIPLTPHPWIHGYFNPETHYVNRGKPTSRPAQSSRLRHGVLIDLPVPCTIKINNQSYPCNESTAEIGFDQPGQYKVVVEAWPYLDKEFLIENPTQ